MKKISFVAILVICAATMVSCGKKYKASLTSDIDTLSYAIGIANGSQIKPYLMQQGVDTAYIADFLRGFNEGAKIAGDKRQEAFQSGVEMGMRMASGINSQIFADDENYKLSRKNLLAGMAAGLKNDTTLMNPNEVMPKIDGMAENIHKKIMDKKYGSYKAEGEKFLVENAKKPGVKSLANGVQYKVIKEGEGAIPSDTARVNINYEGKTIDGNVFDSSYKRGQPVEMMVRQNIPGFCEALTHMPVGSTWEVYIPADQAYGSREMGDIKPYSTLIFKVELLDILN